MRYKDLLSTNDILQLLKNSLNLETKQTGKNIFLLCPFHPDNNPSMSFEPNRKIFSCWSCHFKAYDFFDF
jgi:DNA primase